MATDKMLRKNVMQMQTALGNPNVGRVRKAMNVKIAPSPRSFADRGASRMVGATSDETALIEALSRQNKPVAWLSSASPQEIASFLKSTQKEFGWTKDEILSVADRFIPASKKEQLLVELSSDKTLNRLLQKQPTKAQIEARAEAQARVEKVAEPETAPKTPRGPTRTESRLTPPVSAEEQARASEALGGARRRTAAAQATADPTFDARWKEVNAELRASDATRKAAADVETALAKKGAEARRTVDVLRRARRNDFQLKRLASAISESGEALADVKSAPKALAKIYDSALAEQHKLILREMGADLLKTAEGRTRLQTTALAAVSHQLKVPPKTVAWALDLAAGEAGSGSTRVAVDGLRTTAIKAHRTLAPAAARLLRENLVETAAKKVATEIPPVAARSAGEYAAGVSRMNQAARAAKATGTAGSALAATTAVAEDVAAGVGGAVAKGGSLLARGGRLVGGVAKSLGLAGGIGLALNAAQLAFWLYSMQEEKSKKRRESLSELEDSVKQNALARELQATTEAATAARQESMQRQSFTEQLLNSADPQTRSILMQNPRALDESAQRLPMDLEAMYARISAVR